jgi:hypothetical protein
VFDNMYTDANHLCSGDEGMHAALCYKFTR